MEGGGSKSTLMGSYCHPDFIKSRLQYGFDNWQGLKETLKGLFTNFLNIEDSVELANT